jgi:hypothetical protein
MLDISAIKLGRSQSIHIVILDIASGLGEELERN